MNETILAVKTYLDDELAKYRTWEQFCSGELSRTNLGIESGHAFSKLKDKGVGRETILKFLGPEWKETIVKIALHIINTPEGVLDRKAVEKMPSIMLTSELVNVTV